MCHLIRNLNDPVVLTFRDQICLCEKLSGCQNGSLRLLQMLLVSCSTYQTSKWEVRVETNFKKRKKKKKSPEKK